MSVDDLLLAIIIGGVVLSGAYLRSQYALQRNCRAAERRAESRLRDLFSAMQNGSR
jgi:hypothetical protein